MNSTNVVTKQRWAFSEEELAQPFACNGWDELIAEARNPNTGEHLELGVVVYRNGLVSNRWEDGTAGVPAIVRELANEEDTLYHPTTGEQIDIWCNVEADEEGNLVRLLDAKV